MKLKDLCDYGYETKMLATNDWTCEIDGEEVPVGLLISITDMYEATGEPEFKQYPFITSVEIMALNPSPDIDSQIKETGMTGEDIIPDVHAYCGGVNIEHLLLQTDAINENLMGELKAKSAKLVTVKSDFGTFAAQFGKGSELTYPQFKTEAAAKAFVTQLVKKYANVHMSLIGFVLDRPVNMAGNTGWNTLETQIGKGQ